MIGASNGALVHLAAALGIPWLPQTFLVPVSQRHVHPDEMQQGLEAGLEPGRSLLENNPDIQLHHMHDPNQDRLMLRLMSYFRIKLLKLGEAYRQFLAERLAPGGVILVADCRRRWPVTRLGERHVFQAGAMGGIEPEEVYGGSERVAEYLARYGSHRRQWNPPEPNDEAPEAEWGFEPRLMTDIEALAQERRYRIVRVAFTEPDDPSPLVADLYRWWYAQRRLRANRLLVESFVLMEPWWALRLGAVPFWMKFNTEYSLQALKRYLDARDVFDQIHLMLFMHGTEGAGLPTIEQWREPLTRAAREGSFLGIDPAEYPADFGAFGRYHTSMRKLEPRYPLPGPLALSQLYDFLEQAPATYAVQWQGLTPEVAGRRPEVR